MVMAINMIIRLSRGFQGKIIFPMECPASVIIPLCRGALSEKLKKDLTIGQIYDVKKQKNNDSTLIIIN